MNIQNVVVCAKLLHVPDLNYIENQYPGLSYRQPGFPSLNLKDTVPTLCQIFKNGKIIVIGGKSEVEAKEVFDSYLSRVAELGHDTSYSDYKVQNIVASYNHGKRINLSKIANQDNVKYEPEIFPAAARYRIKDLNITANIFYSGKVMILGAKSIEVLQIAVLRVRDFLNNGENCN